MSRSLGFMPRFNFVIGMILLIAGFVIYQFGFSLILHQMGIPNLLARIFPEGSNFELIGTILQFIGGISGVFGFGICIVNVVYTQRKDTLREIIKLRSYIEQIRIPRPITPIIKCMFCGAKINQGTVFCPMCNKSQI
ncbi:MAG: hypothetical protein ACFFBD_29845 [Candidatus Hodarchaeota archaeon]